MIEQSEYVPKQMNGPVINAFEAGQDAEYTDGNYITKYIHDLSLDNAEEEELENIGLLIGYPRPIVPEGFNRENVFVLGSLPIETDFTRGFSGISRAVGGQFSSTKPSKDELKLSLATYRNLLRPLAKIKRYGVTLKTVDEVARTFAANYTIEWDANADIKITFTDSIGFKNVWVLSQLFYRICTSPQVTVESGGTI